MTREGMKGIDFIVVGEADDISFSSAATGKPNRLVSDDAKRIGKSVAKIRRILTDGSELAVLSSGSDAGMDTAAALLTAEWMKSRSVLKEGSAAMAGSLAKKKEASFNTGNRAQLLAAELGACASMVIRNSDSAEPLGLVLVVNPEYIEEIPKSLGCSYNKAAISEPLAVNHFTIGDETAG